MIENATPEIVENENTEGAIAYAEYVKKMKNSKLLRRAAFVVVTAAVTVAAMKFIATPTPDEAETTENITPED